MTADERAVAAATLASLPLITHHRIRRMLDAFGDPVAALAAVRAGRAERFIGRCEEADPATLAITWRELAESRLVERQLRERGTQVWIADDDGYPIPDPLPDRPPVLLGEGERPDAFDAARVAIVGSRAATPHGLADARELGGYLADAGVTVVSGLAIGIDGAAHEGALDAGGLDRRRGRDRARRHVPAPPPRLVRAGARAGPGRQRARLRGAAAAASASRRGTASSPRWPTSSWSSRPGGGAAR